MTPGLVARRAVEALRAGVPNRDAVRALGSAQPQIEERFLQLLDRVVDDVDQGQQTPGLLIGGDFGSGKSHLMEHLQHLALERNFVCSKIVISKETPFFDPHKLYRSAVLNAVVPDRRDSVLDVVASRLRPDSEEFAELYRWANSGESGLGPQFPATLFLLERAADEDLRKRIISFWSGNPINVADLRRALRMHGQAATYPLQRIRAADLPPQLFAFTARLMVAAGYTGWVLLFDEVELIALYSLKQRARSYAALARWAGKLPGEAFPGLISVFALLFDFDRQVLDARNDLERVPSRLRATTAPADSMLAGQAERGMRLIRRELLQLQRPSDATLDQTYQRLREIHGEAYSWSPPPVISGEKLASTSMREYVRRWITEWDLKRLFPDEAVDLSIDQVQLDLSERDDLEQPSEESDETRENSPY